MAEALVGPLLNKLQEVVLQEVAALGGVSSDISSLRDKLMWLKAFVHETHLRSRHDSNRLVQVLARQTREVAFEAEDAIDEFIVRVDLSRFNPDWVRTVVAFFANLNTQFCVRHSLARKVAALNHRLEGIRENSATFRLDNNQADEAFGPWRPSPFAATYPAAPHGWDVSRVYNLIGRDAERKKLREFLLEERDHLGNMICVVGESGIGKTALVRDIVYGNKTVSDRFAVIAWTVFPPDTSDSVMARLIYEKLSLDPTCLFLGPYDEYMQDKEHRDEQLARENKRCLLVIDSRMDNTKWNKIKPKLPGSGRGSKIVLLVPSWTEESNTTSEHVQLHRLTQDDSRKLFDTSVVGIEEDIQIKDEYYTRVQEITRGLPFFVILLAKLLKTKEYDQWDNVFKYIKKSNEQVDRFRTILTLSFDDLSDELKSCLLYFAGFPENTMIDAHQLVRLWMAEGFLSTKKGMVDMEQLGQHYLKELISRGLVRLVEKASYGHVESVAVHDCIHAFLKFEAQHTCFMEVHYGSFAHAPANVRRIFLHNYNNKFAALTNQLSTLRSVLNYFNEDDIQDESSMNQLYLNMATLLKGSSFLRVIDLEGLNIGRCLPKEIGDMVHLRYLSLRRCWFNIVPACLALNTVLINMIPACSDLSLFLNIEVPASIGRLTNLQTFDLRGTDIKELPDSFWSIKALRHVLGDDLRFPTSAGELELLQTLESVSVEQANGTFGKILGKMVCLHSLHLTGLDEAHKEALRYALRKLTLLVRLSLQGRVIQLDFASLRSLDQLESMELDGRLLYAPPQGNNPSGILLNLNYLKLKSTHVNQAFIDMLAALPVLTELLLLYESYDGEELVFHPDGFKRLTLLRLSNIWLRKIVVEDKSALPKLVSLEIIGAFSEDLPIEGPHKPGFEEKIKRVVVQTPGCV